MNTLTATLTSVTSSDHMSILTTSAGDDLFRLLLAEHYHGTLGESLVLAFKETEVALATTFTATTSNIYRGVITKIEQGNVLSQITLAYHENIITALVPTLTFNALHLHVENEVFWMVSPSEISLLRGHHGG